MLKKAKSYLKPGGKLIIAIENKFGIKYWAGATEDHTGKIFDGIQGYSGVERVRTFSKHELEKLSLEIYSEHYLPKRYPVSGNAPNYDRDRYVFFNEEKVMNELIRDGKFEEYANSFLVFCG